MGQSALGAFFLDGKSKNVSQTSVWKSGMPKDWIHTLVLSDNI
jgi:hypothetical protein